MAESTGISWADSTWNPWVGCSKVSPGCAHCYAETWADRYSDGAVWGDDGVRRVTSDANWRKPIGWEKDHDRFENEHGHRRRVFCASLADVFEPRLELDPVRERLFGLIESTPHLDWLLLTKRPDYAKTWLVDGRRATPDEVDQGAEFGVIPPYYYDGHARFGDFFAAEAPLPNVWLGTSIENSRFTWRTDVLREIPAALRFVSAEPLLGSLYATRTVVRSSELGDRWNAPKPLDLSGIDWVIVGGESGGPRSRPMNPDWAREIRDAILAIWQDDSLHDRPRPPAFHMKQWGSYDERGVYRGPLPTSGGKLLDGVDWCEVPSSPHLTLA